MPIRACVVLTVALGLIGCIPDPPTRVTLDNPSDPTPRFDDPVVWVSNPEDNGTVEKSALFSGEGAPVEFDGIFTPGYEIQLLAARVESTHVGFHIQKIPVTDTVSPGPVFIRGSPALIGNSFQIRVYLRLRDLQAELVSIDSVTLRLR
ncbi:MAG: hypothetical protein ACR2QM_20195 [Longimicrobiales bacterium]